MVVAAAATGTNLSECFSRRGCLSGSPAISFLELPITSMRFSAL